jgi:hypothetical protein
MTDDLSKTGKQDDSRINIHQAYEVAYWTKKWGISETTLKQAVASAGVMVTDVAFWLKKNNHI